ncbi:regulation of thyroid hormone proteinration, partial [Branchiostoma belcheri]
IWRLNTMASSLLYQAFRVDGGPTQYPPNPTPVTADVLEVGLVFAVAILAFSFLVILPGVRGMQRLFFAIMVFFSIFVLATIMVSNFGMEWETAEVHTKVQYKAFIAEEMDGTVGVKIGLRAVNITLKGSGEGELKNEEINYNERFHYGQDGQGRIGFGPYVGVYKRYQQIRQTGLDLLAERLACLPVDWGPGGCGFEPRPGPVGFLLSPPVLTILLFPHWPWEFWQRVPLQGSSLINREFRAAQYRGLPYPILWVAEYFTLDGEDIRWHRSYRLAGYYTLTMLWYVHITTHTATTHSPCCGCGKAKDCLPLWILTNILFCMFIRYGAYFMMLTGGVMLLGNLIFHFLRFGPVLAVPMGTATLVFHYGWCFWLNLAVGSVTLVLGAAILFLDLRFPDVTSTFFSVGSDPDEYYTVKTSVTKGRQQGVGPGRPMQVSGLVSRSREIRPLCEQDGLIAIENLEVISEELTEMGEQKSDSTIIARPKSARPTTGVAAFQKPRRKNMVDSGLPEVA